MVKNSSCSSRKNSTPSTSCFICHRGLGLSPRDALFVVNDESTEDDKDIIGFHTHGLYKHLNPETQKGKVKLAKSLRLIKPIPKRRTQKKRYSKKDQDKARCCLLEMIKCMLGAYTNEIIHLNNSQFNLLTGRLRKFLEVDDTTKVVWAIKIYRQLIKNPKPETKCKKTKDAKLILVTEVAA